MRSGRGQPEFRGQQNPRSELAEHEQRIENLLLLGHIYDIDFRAGKARVTLDYSKPIDGEPIVTDWLPWTVPRAGKNSYWMPPEIGEQVEIRAWSGNIADAVISPALNEQKWPHAAQSGDVERVIYGVPEGGVTDIFDTCFYDFQRDKKHFWRYLKSGGRFRWQTSKGILGSSVVIDDEHVHLRCKNTQIVITEKGIEMHVNGNRVGFELSDNGVPRMYSHVGGKVISETTDEKVEVAVNGQGITKLTENLASTTIQGTGQTLITADKVELSVNGLSVFRVMADTIDASLNHLQIRMILTAEKFTVYVKTAWFYLSQLYSDWRIPGGAVTVFPAGVVTSGYIKCKPDTSETPTPPAVYIPGTNAETLVHTAAEGSIPKTVAAAPEIVLGVPPYYPDRSE